MEKDGAAMMNPMSEIYSFIRNEIQLCQEMRIPIDPSQDLEFLQEALKILNSGDKEQLKKLLNEIRGLSHYFCYYAKYTQHELFVLEHIEKLFYYITGLLRSDEL